MKLGLALGGGAAKGWAHIGVLRVLQEMDLEPDIVAGTSVGSLVGAAYVSEYLDELEAWITELSWADVLALMDIRLSGGLIKGERVIRRLSRGMHGIQIEEMSKPFAAVATDLDNGNEVWLREGLVLDAVRASIAIPPLFSPVKQQERWLVDGGLVNPVPVSLCRALGADVVIAVDLSAQSFYQKPSLLEDRNDESEQSESGAFPMLDDWFDWLKSQTVRQEEQLPSFFDVIFRSVNIMTNRITRSRLAGEPAELLLSPRVGEINLMEFHRGQEGIALGRSEALRNREALEQLRSFIRRN